ncbi:Bgt-50933, partial [Blumeria graminis f. sp. tritici]
DQIISYVESSPANRLKTFLKLAFGPLRHLGVSERLIQREHKKEGIDDMWLVKGLRYLKNYEDTQRMGRSSSQLDI